MRALFEDHYFSTVDPSAGITGGRLLDGPFVIHKPVWAAGSKPVDLWFRIDKDSGDDSDITIYAYATKELARAHDTGTPAGYLASATIAPSVLGDTRETRSTIALADNGATDPTLDVSIEAYGTIAGTTTLSGVIAYTASPDLYACEAIVETLGEYTGSGLVLQDFDVSGDSATRIAVGDPGLARPMPYIWVRTSEFEFLEELSTGSIYAVGYALDITVQTHRMDRDAGSGPQEKAWKTCRSYQAAVESILLDERRTLKGALFTLTSLEGGAPEPSEDSVLYEATITVGAEFLNVWPERDL